MKRREAVLVALTAAATLVVAAALVRQRRWRKERRRTQTRRILREFAEECATPVAKLWEVAEAMAADMKESLSSEKTTGGSLNMSVSYVAPLPSGEEKGLYYGVNLRGKDFIILRAKLCGKTKPLSQVHRQHISLPPLLTSASSQDFADRIHDLCDFIALELLKFIAANPNEDEDEKDEQKKLGFTTLNPTDDEVKKEMLNEMNRALQKHSLKFRVHELEDNTIGDLAGGRYYNKDSIAAVTLGMRTNAAYVEQVLEVSGWNGPVPESGEIVISTEWGDFNSGHLPVTEFDFCLDSESSNPGSRIFEKLVSAAYLGEIVRRVLLRMAEESAIFGENVPLKLMVPYLLSSPDMAAMHQDASEDGEVVNEKLKEIFEIKNSSPEAREIVMEICDIVAERGARLAGAGIVGFLRKLGKIEKKKCVVIVGGGLYEHYRTFRNYLHSSVCEMLGDDFCDHVVIEHCHGGSGAGAVFLASCSTQRL